MDNILNITNGDCAVDVMKEASIPGVFLPWRDVLHDGPVPAGLSLTELSEVRANFIIDRGWGAAEDIKRDFIDRDNTLKLFEEYEKVILWFEHDLYDQLQLLQILDWFHDNRPKKTTLSIICVDQYLGTLTPKQMLVLFRYEEPVTERHFELSSRAWSVFRSDSPEKFSALLKTDTTALPFLEGAIIRLLEEYPSCVNGLSRTAHQALKIISQGEKHPGKIFSHYQESEECMFLGDSSFWVILHAFLELSPALLKLPEDKALTLPTSPDQELTITSAGKEVLSGKRNWLEMIKIDHWIGGVHLTPDNIWYWDSDSGSVRRKV